MNDPHTKNHRPLLEGCSRAWQHHLSHRVHKKKGNGDRLVDDEPFINKRKPSSMMVAKSVSNNGELTLIPVTAKMIHCCFLESCVSLIFCVCIFDMSAASLRAVFH
jgi:hypothetical protein